MLSVILDKFLDAKKHAQSIWASNSPRWMKLGPPYYVRGLTSRIVPLQSGRRKDTASEAASIRLCRSTTRVRTLFSLIFIHYHPLHGPPRNLDGGATQMIQMLFCTSLVALVSSTTKRTRRACLTKYMSLGWCRRRFASGTAVSQHKNRHIDMRAQLFNDSARRVAQPQSASRRLGAQTSHLRPKKHEHIGYCRYSLKPERGLCPFPVRPELLHGISD